MLGRERKRPAPARVSRGGATAAAAMCTVTQAWAWPVGAAERAATTFGRPRATTEPVLSLDIRTPSLKHCAKPPFVGVAAAVPPPRGPANTPAALLLYISHNILETWAAFGLVHAIAPPAISPSAGTAAAAAFPVLVCRPATAAPRATGVESSPGSPLPSDCAELSRRGDSPRLQYRCSPLPALLYLSRAGCLSRCSRMAVPGSRPLSLKLSLSLSLPLPQFPLRSRWLRSRLRLRLRLRLRPMR
eukprot:COSAG01_NODE_168_length_23206_cov_14.301467_1_plen_244_part_10